MTCTLDNVKVGELRPSQMMTPFGIGSIIDLPFLSVIVLGLDYWKADRGVSTPITEDRLLRAVQWRLGSQVKELLNPPSTPDTRGLTSIGIPVSLFPRWMVCSRCHLLAPVEDGLFEPEADWYHPDRNRYVHRNCIPAGSGKPVVLPARFMVACENGHLDDFPWYDFVHAGPSTCKATFSLQERGTSGEARDVWVKCATCGSERPLSDAFGYRGRQVMPNCRARRPHLLDYDDKACDQQVRAILLGASNMWFADILSTLAVPTESHRLAQLVASAWAKLSLITSLSLVPVFRQLGQLGELYTYSDQEIWEAVEKKRAQDAGQEETVPTDLKQPEWQAFTHPESVPLTNDLQLRTVAVPQGFKDKFERVVLLERLRVVQALVGFTRLDSPNELTATANQTTSKFMTISRQKPAWVPATEVRGEGLFIQFKESAIQSWLARDEVYKRNCQFKVAHEDWWHARHLEPPRDSNPGMRYILLHSFAHALMRQLALECGYSAASIRERIYSATDPEPMAGILIYTSAPDSEGTLGGLVSLGEPQELRRHIEAALRAAQLCASDPLCAEHTPGQKDLTLHGAACHACMFAPETSCEKGNKYLDRSLLAATLQVEDLAFFVHEVEL